MVPEVPLFPQRKFLAEFGRKRENCDLLMETSPLTSVPQGYQVLRTVKGERVLLCGVPWGASRAGFVAVGAPGRNQEAQPSCPRKPQREAVQAPAPSAGHHGALWREQLSLLFAQATKGAA